MRMVDILPSHVRDYLSRLEREGTGNATIKYCKAILDAIFTTALNDQVTFLHPGKGVKPPASVAPLRTIITPEQFDIIYDALGSPDFQLLVETDIESGVRWGELTELRVGDLNQATGVVTISRVVEQLSRTPESADTRFVVRDYPKNKEHRRFRLSPSIVAKIKTRIVDHQLARDDLLFSVRGADHFASTDSRRSSRSGHARPHRTQRRRQPLSPRHDNGVFVRPVPL